MNRKYVPEGHSPREAILAMKARKLSHRRIAQLLDCSVSTVSYWLNPKSRERRIAAQVSKRARPLVCAACGHVQLRVPESA